MKNRNGFVSNSSSSSFIIYEAPVKQNYLTGVGLHGDPCVAYPLEEKKYGTPFVVSGKDLKCAAYATDNGGYYDCHYTCPVCGEKQDGLDWWDTEDLFWVNTNEDDSDLDLKCEDCGSYFVMDGKTIKNDVDERLWECHPCLDAEKNSKKDTFGEPFEIEEKILLLNDNPLCDDYICNICDDYLGRRKSSNFRCENCGSIFTFDKNRTDECGENVFICLPSKSRPKKGPPVRED